MEHSNDHDTLIRIETKLDTVLEWATGHKTEHMRGRLAVWSVLLAAILACIVL